MVTLQETTLAPNPAHLQTLHWLATARHDKILAKLAAAENGDGKVTDYEKQVALLVYLRYDEQHQLAFISKLQALLAEVSVDPLPR
jgi:hypothetical protein